MGYIEADTRAKLIDPWIKSSNWLESQIVREYYFTDGRKLIGCKRGQQYYVDYLLVYKNINIAIIEAKAEDKDPLDGLQQSINYCQKLKVDFVYTTNGHKTYEHNLLSGKGKLIDSFPTPQTLFERKFPKLTPVKEMESDKLSSLIKLSGIDRNKLKVAFDGAVNIREGYFGLQREIYK